MASRFADASRLWVKRDIDRDTAVEGDGGEILIEEGLEENDLVPVFEERHEHRVLTCIRFP